MTKSSPVRLDPAQHGWLFAAPLQRLFAVFAAAGAEARAVGGAVRNSLLGLPVADIDLALNRPPEFAEHCLQAAGIKTVRTGFAHGTITAVLDGQGYEITSLRRDVATDGRRATVAYSDDWAADAARRDFTVNALYADAAGQLYDFHAGRADLAARHIRFIGDPAQRIAEDVLRILRFFRFHAHYGRGEPDAAGLAACLRAAPQLTTLSRERVTQEWHKLLLAPEPLSVLRLMQSHDVLAAIVPLALDCGRLARLLALPEAQAPDFILRFAALLPEDRLLEPVLQAALRLSNRALTELVALAAPQPLITAANLTNLLYRRGAVFVRQRLLLQAAAASTAADTALLARAAAWQSRAFPLSGQDLLALGLSPSPLFGELMRTLEEWWLAADAVPDRNACLAELKRRLPAR